MPLRQRKRHCKVRRGGEYERQSFQCLSKWSNQVSYSSLTSPNPTLVPPYHSLMTLCEPFFTDNIYPGALLNALCHPAILNHMWLRHKPSLHPNIMGDWNQKQSRNCRMNVCADEYNGTDKDTETKPDVVFLGVSSESPLGFFPLLS